MKIFRVLSICSFLFLSLVVFGQRQVETLDHGLLAIKRPASVYISWRVLASEADAVAYNLYRDGVKVNDSPLTGASNLTDEAGLQSSQYELRKVIDGVEFVLGETASVWEKRYIDIPVREVNGGYSSHTLNDASVGDLDGDGQYEIVVKRIAVNMEISSTDYHLLEAYELDGTFLWSINIGPNIYNDKEFNFLVWDLDGDGKAEVATRTSEGTIDGLGNQIGDVDNDGKTNYRYSITSQGFRAEGPDFLSIFDGETGEELDRENYIEREPISQWGLPGHNITQLAHRSTKCMFTVAFLDGKTPSFVIGRGIYEKIALEAWKFENGQLQKQWYFASDQVGNEKYDKQGFHNLTQGDVDNDGRDEIMYGSMCVDDDGTGLYSTDLGHGDAQHLSDINPNRPGLEYFGCLEGSTGGNYRDAKTGEILYYHNIGRDMGRAGCSDITPNYPGMEMWGPTGFPFLSATGKEITNLSPPASMNFFIWWDGDLIREMLDHAWSEPNGTGTITKYNNGANTNLLTASGTLSNNWTKGNPSLSADILGDWREEVIWRRSDNAALRLYTTVDPTEYRIYTLMHDPQYRAAVGWQPNSYNQPPHPGFFIGHNMDSIPPAPVMLDGQKTFVSGTWDSETSTSWEYDGQMTDFSDGDSILFDISSDNSIAVNIEGSLMPSDIRVISPYDLELSGSGVISGKTKLTKAGIGKLTITNENLFTGISRVWSGELCAKGSLNSKVLVKRFAAFSGNGHLMKGLSLEKYAGMTVSGSPGDADTLFVEGSLSFATSTNIKMDLSDDPAGSTKVNDIIILDGDLFVDGELTIDINRLDADLSPGTYTLIEFSGSFTGDLGSVSTDGITDLAHELKIEDGKLILDIPETRPSRSIIWQGSVDNLWDMYNTMNWLSDGSPDVFIGDDTVIFNDQAIQAYIQIMGNYGISHFLFEASKNITLGGDGYITGDGTLLKRGSGKLIMNNQNTYTGTTTIEEGILTIPEIKNGGAASGIGAASSEAAYLVLDGGTLEILATGNISTDKGVFLGSDDGSIRIPFGTGSVTFNGIFKGEGYLEKKGNGSIILKTNEHGGTIIDGGTVILGDEDANYNGLGDEVIFRGGSLQMYNNNNTYTNDVNWAIQVEEGERGTLIMDGRSALTGTMSGSGTLELVVPWVRNEVQGDWSQFSGTLNVTTDYDGGLFIVGHTTGLQNAAVYLDEKVRMIYNESEDVTVEIGELSGHEASIMGAGGQASNTITWKVGSSNNNFTYDGVINNDQYKNSGSQASLIKTGSGRWTLTNENIYAGTTVVEEGTLLLENSTGSATGSGDVTCKAGAFIAGNGSMAGSLELENDATLLPGYGEIGSLDIGGNLQMSESSILMIDLDRGAGTCDLLNISGSVTLRGTLLVSNLGAESYSEGDAFQILVASSDISGSFSTIYPLTPGDGLEWDTDVLYSQGYLRVIEATGVENTHSDIGMRIFPNPFTNELDIQMSYEVNKEDILLFSLDGRKMHTDISSDLGFNWKMNTTTLPIGSYILTIKSKDGITHRKIALKNKK